MRTFEASPARKEPLSEEREAMDLEGELSNGVTGLLGTLREKGYTPGGRVVER